MSPECAQYVHAALQRLSVGDLDNLDFDSHGFQDAAEVEIIRGLQNVHNTLRSVADQNEAFAGGDFRVSETVALGNGRLRRSVDSVASSMSLVADQADTIAKGDYTAQVEPRSKNDKLGIALFEMTKTLREASDVCAGIAVGELNVKVNIKGNNDLLGNAINQIVDNLADTADQADTIAKGDYTAQVEPRSKNDKLGIALFEMTKTLREASDVCAGIAVGELNVKVNIKGNNDLLGNAINQIVDNLADTTDQADTIARGDYTAQVEPRSKNDKLGIALFEMTKTLRLAGEVVAAVADGDFSRSVQVKGDRDLLGLSINKMTSSLASSDAHNQRDRWLKEGQTSLGDAIRGESDTAPLVDKALSTLANYLNAQVGVFYVADQNSNALNLTGTYAFERRKRHSTTIVSGEGILGQALKEKKSFILEDVPADHLSVESGLGNSAPRNIIVMPFVHEGTVKGLLELGSFKPFSDVQHELLKLVSETLAIAINSAQDKEQLAATLERAQRQTEELQTQQEELSDTNRSMLAQQEELRVSNEELTEQTEGLKRSEEELRESQEELRASNEELSEKTTRIDEQRREVETKNRTLVVAQERVEEKARDLALASKYKSEFLANMSHELRTPLNSLLILSRSFAKNSTGNLTAEQVQEAEVIHSGGQSLLVLINDILDLSKVEAGKLEVSPEEVVLSDFARELEHLFAPVTREKGLQFNVTIADTLPASIVTDPLRAQQIVKNLISNAAKFTSTGSVTLRLEPASPSTHFQSAALGSAPALAIAVQDTGIGIPTEKQQLIFEAFQQADGSTSRQYGGTGLGLTISRELTKLLGGELQLESELGRGSTFTLYLPMDSGRQGPSERDASSQPAALRAGPGTQPAQPAQLSPRNDSRGHLSPATRATASVIAADTSPIPRPPFEDDRDSLEASDRSVLIIEDDTTFACLLVKLCRKKGYKCLAALDGTTGLRLAVACTPSAILLDLGLPGMDGTTVLDTLKADVRTRGIPVHVISGQHASSALLARGAMGILKKPIDEDQLNQVFVEFEEIANRRISRILLIEDDPGCTTAVRSLFQEDATEITPAKTGREALERLRSETFDCIILDLKLPDISGFEVLEQAHADDGIQLPPAIVYTGRELTREEHIRLEEHASTIVIKGAASPERLISEVSLFLHSVDFLMPQAHSGARDASHSNGEFNGDTILLVDDDVRNCFALSKILREAGLKVKLADNGQKCLDTLATHSEVDLVIMDIMMPIMDGYTAIGKIREQATYKSLPIIALTAKALPEDRAKALDVGANDYLAKPVDEDKLLSLIRVLLYREPVRR